MDQKKPSRLPLILAVLALIGLCIVSIIAIILGLVLINRNREDVKNNSNDTGTVSSPVVNPPTPEPIPVATKCRIDNSPTIDSTDAYEINVKRPFVSGCESQAQNDLNQYIIDSINQDEKTVKFTDPSGSAKNSLDLDYEVVSNSTKFISILIKGYIYLGGAHGDSVFIPINYDLVHNKIIKFEDLETDPLFVSKISSYSINALKIKLNEPELDSSIESGASADSANFQIFNLYKNGIKITFGDYQVGPYALGPQEVLVPWSEVSNYASLEIQDLLGV
ncbi:MAG: DUF4163 domain-containing protein [Candidatus Dojkabacteria bacterium]